ncbi:zinc ribbon domain-containing protein [Mycolicibacterium tusciae]|nr:zinc ribbon domain-containing protein [Mycolicibacterium tusciae]
MGLVARRLPVLGVVNSGKDATLSATGSELDRVRAGVWARFSGPKTAHLSKRQIRDRLMAEHAPDDFVVPQRLWRATVEDTVDKIRAWQQAVMASEVRPKIYARTDDDNGERKRMLVLAKTGRWRQDAWLSRQCRKAFAGKSPRPRRSGRIVADNCSYDVQRDAQGRVWLAVMTPTRGDRLRLNLGPLPEELVPTSTIEISRDGRESWQVIGAYPDKRVCSIRPRHKNLTPSDGIDAGVSEVFTTTDGRRYGAGQYQTIAKRAERDRARGKARNKLRAVRNRHLARAAAAAEAGDGATARAAKAKARKIERHNLGHKKLSAQRSHDRAVTKDTVYQAVHDLVDSTAHIVAEDLSGLRGKSKFGRTASRVYAAWQRSFLADALASVPSRRGSAVTLVNPAYTSQQVHPCGHLGVRRGKNVYCQTAGCPQQGIVFDTEINAARVIRDRATDPQITRYTSKHEVKRILVQRAGTVENCPTTTQATTVMDGGCERNNLPPKRTLPRSKEQRLWTSV